MRGIWSSRRRARLPAIAAGAALVAVAATAAPAAAAPRTGAPRPHADAGDVPASPLDIRSVTFGQRGDQLVLRLTTAGRWSSKQLSRSLGRYVCIKLFYGRLTAPRARICVERAGRGAGLRYTRLDPSGKPLRVRSVPAEVSRPDDRSLRATFPAASAALPSGRYSWQAESAWLDPAQCVTRATCVDLAPDNANVIARLRPAAPAGCSATGATQRSTGSRGRREVALTFDDGPTAYTPAIVRILEREQVPATFFMVGGLVPGHSALLKRILRGGSMLANHTLSHANVAGAGGFAARQIAATQARIRRASGFTPCLFRPPYGATSSALNGVVRSFGALSILWDVDPQDWLTPGTATIVSRVVGQARSGSIILLHDGGGPRSQTVAALPAIIRTLRGRGLRFVTVTELLRLPVR